MVSPEKLLDRGHVYSHILRTATQQGMVNNIFRIKRCLLSVYVRKFKLRKLIPAICIIFGCALLSTQSVRTKVVDSDSDSLDAHHVRSEIRSNLTRTEDYWIHVAKGSECAKARPQKRGSLPLVNLLSIPGSGNTWLRWVIERATGLCTGSLYGDTELRVAGLNCEDYVTPYLFKRTIAVRSHYYHQLNASTVLFLIRNPYDAIVSDYNRVKSNNNHTGTVDISEFRTQEFQNFAERRAAEWLSEIETTFSSATNVFVVFYENFRDDLETVLRQITVFLRVLVPPARLECAVRSQMGKAKRQRRDLPDGVWTPYLTNIIEGLMCQAHKIFFRQKLLNAPDFYKESCQK